ncbi:ammonium transporter [Leptospira ilyithenensis]|uniref:Ammonium transporter n=1 Tax=Leptospira ilyithenensis TaxID=2484901 RepID=A0A4R9LN97_9LEPT|nr:ammonium transporter [Leptospira ilyithenensis]TGN08353.1 ammonium transporter [Leptospira ilyithenensis]
MTKIRISKTLILLFLTIVLVSSVSSEAVPTSAEEKTTVSTADELASLKAGLSTLRDETNWLWTCIAGFLVFFMQAGFAYVEAGFTRAKNTVNILMKNFSDMTVGAMAFWLIGFSLLFGPKIWDSFVLGTPAIADSMLSASDGSFDPSKYTFFVFQMAFAATAATIVSGALAERTKFPIYIIFSFLITGFIYPISGSMMWGGLFGNPGFLETINFGAEAGKEGVNFLDFAGSTVVHSVGAWAGLAGAIVLGPRLGKYQSDGRVYPILGHNMSMAALGVFILWIGWFGFNPGSTTSVDGGSFAAIAVVTHMAGSAGALGAMFTTWLMFKKPDIGLTLNGGLAGLVAITAPCDGVTIGSAVIIGAVAGILVVFSVLFFDKIKVDDPVGAVSVHGICGVWGTLSCGLFNLNTGLFYGGGWNQLIVQAIGVGIVFAWAFGTSLLIFLIFKYTLGLRVSEEEELVGLDILEHGNEAYPVSK